MWGLSGLSDEPLASEEGPCCTELLLEIHTEILADIFVSMSACTVRSSEQTTLNQTLILAAVLLLTTDDIKSTILAAVFSYSPQMISRAQCVM